ncbi:MAG: hypothetical protein NTY80_05145 [candidate division SR1 bacterium]|nr:hypothetical protein [candidate division SR1 bacterium]
MYKLDYKQPLQNITTISQETFSDYGICEPKDMSYILKTINTGIPFSEDSISVDNQKSIDTLKYTQYYKIKKNGETLLQIQDYSTPDNDQVKINGEGYTISNTPIHIDLSTLVGNKVIVEIINEGTMPPNTLLLRLGTYKKRLEGKKGEIIVLEFEE